MVDEAGSAGATIEGAAAGSPACAGRMMTVRVEVEVTMSQSVRSPCQSHSRSAKTASFP